MAADQTVTESQNISTNLGAKVLERLGIEGVDGYEDDAQSLKERERRMATWHKQYAGVKEAKSWPFPGASFVHVPLLTVASLQFHARAGEALLPAKGIAHWMATGAEDEPRARRGEKHMNYQMMHQMTEWMQGMDRTLLQLPLYGSVFRKVYWDARKRRPCGQHIPASDLVVAYHYTGHISEARRITHRLRLTPNELKLRERQGMLVGTSDLKAGQEWMQEGQLEREAKRADGALPATQDDELPRLILEQHGWHDLDGDGIREPYVVTIDQDTRRVLRVTSRRLIEEGEEEVLNYFVHYQFSPAPDSFYGIGLGLLLEGLGTAADSLINQIIDAGTLANTQGGFVSARSGIKKGDLTFAPGEFKPVDTPTEKLSDAIFPFNFKGPDNTLFVLLGNIQQYAQQISSVSDILQGIPPPSNTTATSVISVLEQGLKFFSAVHKRVRASLGEELRLIYQWNRLYLDDDEYNQILGRLDNDEQYKMWRAAIAEIQALYKAAAEQAVAQGLPPPPAPQMPPGPFSIGRDYARGHDVVPVADPNIVSQAQRVMIAQQIYQLATTNPLIHSQPAALREATKRYLEAMDVADIDKLLPEIPEPAPPPDIPAELENAGFLKNQPATALPQQDHGYHMRILAEFLAGDYGKLLEKVGRDLAEQHQRDHAALQYLKEKEAGSVTPIPGADNGRATAGAEIRGPAGGGSPPLEGTEGVEGLFSGAPERGPESNASASLLGRMESIREEVG